MADLDHLGGGKQPSAGYKFNSFEEIKSHSSILFNERVAILFYLLDMHSIQMNMNHEIPEVLETRAILKQIYKNIRMLLRFNATCRVSLNLDTQDEGIYVPDVALGMIDKMLEHCEINGYTFKKLHIIIDEINRAETLIRDILQYFHYFIRPDFRQKPDIDIATDQYKEMADMRTVEELRALVGRSSKIDFESLGSNRIELNQEEMGDVETKEMITYNEELDGEEKKKNESTNDGPSPV
jgi:hypothetical protein